MEHTVYIAAAARTPIGELCGALASVSAPQLGAEAIRAAIRASGISPEFVQSVYMGNVLSANLGQAPARQAARFAGLPDTADCTTINKVCASGLKAVALGALAVRSGEAGVVVAGGMESMSNVPFYIDGMRTGRKLGHSSAVDGVIRDGLWDVYNDFHMGSAGELCARTYGITREEQDDYAALSYRRALDAQCIGKFSDELTPVTVYDRRGAATVVDSDEAPSRVRFDKLPSLRPAFEPDGTITAANASSVNDGAAAVVLADEHHMQATGAAPLGRIIAAADAACAPEWFTVAPAEAVRRLLRTTGLEPEDIDLYEINEAYACVALVNSRLLDIPVERLNVYGGAVALGHPIGASGARILCTLLSALRREGGRYGIAAVCNGGGGATAVLVETVS